MNSEHPMIARGPNGMSMIEFYRPLTEPNEQPLRVYKKRSVNTGKLVVSVRQGETATATLADAYIDDERQVDVAGEWLIALCEAKRSI